MATRSRIGLLTEDSVRSIYCHWDGYPDDPCGVGEKLKAHYTDPAKVEQLLDLGDLSILGAEIGSKQSFEKPVEDWCLAYGRDRGEEGIEAKTHPKGEWPDYGQEYEYTGTVVDGVVHWATREV